MKKGLLLSLLLSFSASVFGQEGYVAEYNAAMNSVKSKDFARAKVDFLRLNKQYPKQVDVLHWLGLAYDISENLDSAILCYQQSLALNEVGKSDMFTQIRLTRALLRHLDFERAYAQAIVGVRNYPDDPVVINELRDVCKWAYYIKYHALNPQYLTNRLVQEVYSVNSTGEEYLILPNLRNKQDDALVFELKQRTDGPTDYLQCHYRRSEEKVELKFKKLWRADGNKELFNKYEKIPATVFAKTNETPFVRLGAFLAGAETDAEIEECLAIGDFGFRFCACAAVNATTSAAVKEKCKADPSVEIQQMTKIMRYYR